MYHTVYWYIWILYIAHMGGIYVLHDHITGVISACEEQLMSDQQTMDNLYILRRNLCG